MNSTPSSPAPGPLVPGATQAVFGEGPAHAAIAFVGEQPGDQEDLQGRPFVGPAGQLLVARHGARPGSTRDTVYLTNAVKHFKFEERGKRRIHAKPTAGEVKHYRPLLMKELDLVQPRLVVALGGTALLALSGKAPAGHEGARPGASSKTGPATSRCIPPICCGCPNEADKRRRPTRISSAIWRRIHDMAEA